MSTKAQQPLVSVIIPTYSRPDNIVRAIDSVLAQTYKNIEIIVVDDNGVGTPYQIETEKILADYIVQNQITYLKHEVNKNGSAARNTGFCASHGEYVNFLDDDDVFLPQKIEKQVKRLLNSNDYDACYCHTKIYGKRRNILWQPKEEGNLVLLVLTCKSNFNTSSVLFSRSSLIDIEGWDERFSRHQDWELFVRFFQHHKICLPSPPEILLEKYYMPNVISKNPLKAIDYRVFYLKEMEQYVENTGRKNYIYKCQMENLCADLFSNNYKKEGMKMFVEIFKYGFPERLTWMKMFYYLVH